MTSDIFFFLLYFLVGGFLLFYFFLPLKTWAKRASTRRSRGSLSDGPAACVRTNERAWWERVYGQNLLTHSLGRSSLGLFFGEMYKKQTKREDGWGRETWEPKRRVLVMKTREWKKCPYPCVVVVPFKDVWSNQRRRPITSISWPTWAARSLSVTCATVSDQQPQTPRSSARNRRRKKREEEEEEEGGGATQTL